MKMEQSVPKRRHIKFRRRGITEEKADNCRYEFGHWPVSVPIFNPFHKIPGYTGCLSCHLLPVPIATSELHSLISSPRVKYDRSGIIIPSRQRVGTSKQTVLILPLRLSTYLSSSLKNEIIPDRTHQTSFLSALRSCSHYSLHCFQL